MSVSNVVDHFLLSHHSPAERYRCIVLRCPFGRYLVCTRCAGAFLGLLIGLPAMWFFPHMISPWILFLAFPDWVAYTLLRVRGFNIVRLLSGVVIGLIYALNVRELLHLHFRADLWCVNLIAVFTYGLVVWCLFRRRRRSSVTTPLQMTSRTNRTDHGTLRPLGAGDRLCSSTRGTLLTIAHSTSLQTSAERHE